MRESIGRDGMNCGAACRSFLLRLRCDPLVDGGIFGLALVGGPESVREDVLGELGAAEGDTGSLAHGARRVGRVWAGGPLPLPLVT